MPDFTNADLEIRPYEPFTLGLSGCDDGCTIVIQDGDSDDPEDVKLLTKNAKGSFKYLLLPDELPSGVYVFKLIDNDSGEIDYSAEWEWDAQYDSVPSFTKPDKSAAPTGPLSDPTGSPSGSSNAGIGSGALAGIVVGFVAAVFFILAGAWLCCRRRRRDATSHGPTLNRDGHNSLASISELGQAKECQVQVIPASDVSSPPPAYTAQDEADSNQLPGQPPLAPQTQSWSTTREVSQPVEPTALVPQSSDADGVQTRASLVDRHAQLEARRQRFLELQQIEEEQAEVERELSKLPRNDGD